MVSYLYIIGLNVNPEPYRRARRFLVLALFLGLLSFAAVLQPGVECQSQQGYLQLTDGISYPLTESGGRIRLANEGRQCQLVAGEMRILLPQWFQAVLDR
jgi:hypothetical protein